MAISYVGAGTFAEGADVASLSPALPASLQDGDLLLALAMGAASSNTITITMPAGYTTLTNIIGSGAGLQNPRMHLAWHKYAAGDGAPAISYNSIAAKSVVAQVAAFRGVNTISPLDVLGTAFTGGSAVQDIGAITGITPLTAGAVVLVVGAKGDNWTSVATLSGDGLTWAEIGEPTTIMGSTDASLVWDYALGWASGAIAAKTFTVTGGANAESVGQVLSLKPALPKSLVLPQRSRRNTLLRR